MFARSSISAVALAAALTATAPVLALDLGVSLGGGAPAVSVDTGGGAPAVSVDTGGGAPAVSVDTGGGAPAVSVDTGGGPSVSVDTGGGPSVSVDTGGGASVGVNTGGNAGADLGASVTTGGNTGVNLGARVNTGGNTGVGATVTTGGNTGGQVEANVQLNPNAIGDYVPSLPGIGNPLATGGGSEPVRARVNVGTEPVRATVAVASEPDPTPATPNTISGEVRVLALGDEAGRLEALNGLLGDSRLADVDLDGAIDDRRIAIVPVGDVLSADSIARISASIGAGAPGRDQLAAQINASYELGSVLGREGVPVEDVVAVQIGENGMTEVFVLPAGSRDTSVASLEATLGSDQNQPDGNIADIDLLTGADAIGVDVALLDDDQRLDLARNLLDVPLADGTDAAPLTGNVAVVDLDNLLGGGTDASIDALIGGTEGRDPAFAEIDGDVQLQNALQAAGIAPDAAVAVRVLPSGDRRLFVSNAALEDGGDPVGSVQLTIGGDGGTANDPAADVADADIDLLTGADAIGVDVALLDDAQRLDLLRNLLDVPVTDGTDGVPLTGNVAVVDLDNLLGGGTDASIDALIGGTEGRDAAFRGNQWRRGVAERPAGRRHCARRRRRGACASLPGTAGCSSATPLWATAVIRSGPARSPSVATAGRRAILRPNWPTSIS